MTLVEFLAPLRRSSNRDKILALLYYKHRYDKIASLAVQDIRTALRSARVTAWRSINVADVLAKSGHYVDSVGARGNRLLWKLTDSGAAHVRTLLNLPEAQPEVEHDVSSLSAVAAKIRNKEARDYVEEAIKCLQIGARRAAVVFLWVGAVRVLQTKMIRKPTTTLNAAVQKHDPKARKISSIDHFSYIKDKTLLLAAQELGLLDKSEKDTLQEALDLRNRCGHPAKYTPGEKKVSSFIEDLVQVGF
jgi:hypothetical protein